jgi:hypothetical protein
MQAAGYNRRHRMRHSQRLTSQFSVCLMLVLALAPACQAAEDWQPPAADLAHQIAALTGPGGITISIRNNSSIAADDVLIIRRSLLNELSKLGISVKQGTDAATIVRVTLSQNARQGLWVAEVQQGPEIRVAMVNVPTAASATTQQGTLLQLRKALLFAQAEPILDAQLISLPGDLPSTSHLVVLSAEQLAIYHHDTTAWVKDQTFAITHSRPYPRDVRGRLQPSMASLFNAYLPGVVCTASQPVMPSATGIALTCADSDDPWPTGSRKAFYNSSRNYFTGVMVPNQGPETEPFYSVAELVQKRGTTTIYSEVGGQVRIYDGGTLKSLAGSRDWGSDLAAVQSGCGSGAQLLATASGDATQDSLLAYEIAGRDAIAASSPLPVDGRITAMWPAAGATTPAVTMIVEKRQPLGYEAYSVSVVCN